MHKLLNVYHKGSVENYLKEFDGVRYATSVHNLELDETLYVAHFIKGLKRELQGSVQSHLPTIVDHVALLAQIEQMVLEKQRQKSLKLATQPKFSCSTSKPETRVQNSPLELSKERLVKGYQRQNGLCFMCGENLNQATKPNV